MHPEAPPGGPLPADLPHLPVLPPVALLTPSSLGKAACWACDVCPCGMEASPHPSADHSPMPWTFR